MLRRGRSSGSHQKKESSTSAPDRKRTPTTLSHLLRMSGQRKSTHESEDDEDADLRSLLSGNSLGEAYAGPGQNPLRPLQSRGSSPITHLPSLQSDESNANMVNINAGNTGGLGLKKALYLLGAIILAVGLVGPSGLLWDAFEGSESTSDGTHRVSRNAAHHGDKHHHLSPAHVDERRERVRVQSDVHPMMRSGKVAAPGSQKHGQFGTKRTKKDRNRKGRNKENGGGWGVKEAINNLDKVFLDNHPVAAGSTVKKTRKRQQGQKRREDSDEDFLNDDAIGEGGGVVPVIHADDEALPAHADEMDADLPASDALECRASVKAFVINATDIKDECDGLRKAFDKTCSVHSELPGAGAAPAAGNAAAGAGVQHGRRLSERGRPHLWNLIPEAFNRELMKARGKIRSPLRRRLEDARMMRANRTLHETETDAPSGGSRHGAKKMPFNEQRKMEDEASEESDDESDEGAPAKVVPQQKQEQHGPLVSLNIPTADKHLSDEMLNDALLLQQSSDPKPVSSDPKQKKTATSLDTAQASPAQLHSADQAPETQVKDQPQAPAVAVSPNITAESAEAVQDAAESAEAIRTAVEGVKNIMNDPKSIEARTCCASILSVFHEHCDPTTTGVEDYSDRRLLVVVFVITACGMVKSLIRHLHIRWLPEAGGCILVGVFGYLILQHMPHVQFAFDHDMFLRIMVPPIVFEAAVKINKQSFRRHVVPITIFAIVGTLASTTFTALLLHHGSSWFSKYVSVIPMKESLIFGALISSIDPIAVLSVLSNIGMTDSDTIYVLIFGESLLNDGVAIVLFQTLVHFLDESLVIDGDVLLDAFMHFVVVALGSVAVGALSGACSTVYFAMMHGCQTPMVEVIMFCCWSFIPYYICDMIEWSGIVAIVANGFVMDLYVIGQNRRRESSNSSEDVDEEIDFLVNGSNGNSRTRQRQQQCRSVFSYQGHLSQTADTHVHFVIEIFATLMETAIFAYLGLFLFSPRYHWNGYLTVISIAATVMGRVIMIPLFSHVANMFNRISASRNRVPNDEGVHIDRRMQLVLIFAGLRGAMSFALVEHIPMFDTTTGQGSRFKPELKAMTSASVIFTVFVLGGATSYLMERLGYSLNKRQTDSIEIAPLVHDKRKSPKAVTRSSSSFGQQSSSMRQRGPR